MENLNQMFSSRVILTTLGSKVDDFLFSHQRVIIRALERAHKNSDMIGILGMEGMGKSSAVASYLLTHDHVYYVRVGQSYSVKSFFHELAFQISGEFPPQSENTFTTVKRLSYLLTKSTERKIIIIDDAGLLTKTKLGFWRELRENTLSTTAFTFVGLQYFRDHLERQRQNGVIGVAEFIRRIQSWVTIESGLQEHEIVEFAAKKGISQELMGALSATPIFTVAELENTIKNLLYGETLATPRTKPRPPIRKSSKTKTQKVKKMSTYDDFEDDTI